MKIQIDFGEARALNAQLKDCKERLLVNKQQIDRSLKILKPLFEYHLVRDINTDIYWKLSSLISSYEKAINELELREQMLAETADAVVETVNEIKDNSGLSISRNAMAAEKIRRINPPRQIQSRRHGKENSKGKWQGTCNVSAMTTLLNRAYALNIDNIEQSDVHYFTIEDVFEGNNVRNLRYQGNKKDPVRNPNGHELYSYSGGTASSWYNSTYTNGHGVSYSSHAITAREARRAVNNDYGGSYEEYVAHLLDEHPEGICVRSDDADHVAVITRYERMENGDIQLYVNDPVNNRPDEQRIQNAQITKQDKDDLWDELDSNCAFVYLEREK